MTFGYLCALFIRMCQTIEHGHIYDEYMVLALKQGMTTRLPISPTSLTELGGSHVKKFHTNICFV
jgi:hypothetical protein